MKGCMQKNLLNPPSRVQQVFVRKVLQLVCNKYNVVLIQYYLSVWNRNYDYYLMEYGSTGRDKYSGQNCNNIILFYGL